MAKDDKVKKVRSWQHYLSIVSKYAHGTWYFRGVSSKKHTLIPKIGRPASRDKYDPIVEHYALRVFKAEAVPYLSYHPSTELEWLTLAQHHGLPTRLLDWSRSPLVAAFFAVENLDGKDDACVYAIQRNQTVRSDHDPFKGDKVFFFRPPHITERIPAQSAAFSIHVEPTKAFEPDDLYRFIIPRGLRYEFERQLAFFGFHRAKLFPSLDGLADFLKTQVRHWIVPEEAKKRAGGGKA